MLSQVNSHLRERGLPEEGIPFSGKQEICGKTVVTGQRKPLFEYSKERDLNCTKNAYPGLAGPII